MSFKLLKSTIIISAMTAISRVFGLIRDIVIGTVFGPGLSVDVFIVSFKIPNFLRRLFAEGGFSQAFVPVLSEYKERRKEEEVQKIIHMIDPPDILTKHFLYQIIANKISSIDVDKIDYIQRDSYHIGFGLSEKYERLITMCRVVNFEGNRTLAWPEKLQDEILSLFETRYRLHKKVYNHHTVKAGEYIITEILDNMLENVDLHFSKLNDAMILFPVNEKVIALKEKIDKRELPKMIGERVLSYNEVTEEVKQFEQKLDNVVAILNGCNIENRGWSKIKIGFISGNGDNPLKRVVYFKKNEDPHYLEEYTSFMAPKNYQEYIYRIYINDSRHFDNAKSIWLHTI